MRTLVVIPTLNGKASLAAALESLERQPLGGDVQVVVVDNGSTDGTAEMIAERFGWASVHRNEQNLGFGRALNAVALDRSYEADVLVLLNNDVICGPRFIERLLAPFADERVAMVAGVLTQSTAPDMVDSAGVEVDTTLHAWDLGWNRPTTDLGGDGRAPLGPCGGAAAYRLEVFRSVGGFDETLFAYWEDTDLALRIRETGWQAALAADAVAEHRHGGTVGAKSSWGRRLDAFGRGYVIGKYGVTRRPLARLQMLVIDWPMLVWHLVRHGELDPIRARRAGVRAGRERPRRAPPLELATLSFRDALGRRFGFACDKLRGRLPAHFEEH